MIAQMIDGEQAGFDAVVEIGGEIGDLIGEVDDLGFERRSLIEEIGREFRVPGCGVVTRVLDDAFADTEREVEAAMRGVALLEVLDDAQSVDVVVEAQSMTLQGAIESAFAGVAEGRMADVVDQRERFSEVFVERERAGDVTGDLHDFDRMCQARAEVIRGARGEDLRLAGEASKGASLHDALAVALERSSVRVRRRGKGAGEQRRRVVIRYGSRVLG